MRRNGYRKIWPINISSKFLLFRKKESVKFSWAIPWFRRSLETDLNNYLGWSTAAKKIKDFNWPLKNSGDVSSRNFFPDWKIKTPEILIDLLLVRSTRVEEQVTRRGVKWFLMSFVPYDHSKLHCFDDFYIFLWSLQGKLKFNVFSFENLQELEDLGFRFENLVAAKHCSWSW